ncbi:hypothetical protein M3Y99_01454000 [Aphelenchoides fujianensis]|nr:hypothetical protein M3Y99_01454000 [Aphelenchoides fujianensis]
MDIPSEDFRRTACLIVNGSRKSHAELALLLKQELQKRLFVGEEVVIESEKEKRVGIVSEVLNGTSPHDEGDSKYNVLVGDEVVQGAQHFELKPPTEGGWWMLRNEFRVYCKDNDVAGFVFGFICILFVLFIALTVYIELYRPGRK